VDGFVERTINPLAKEGGRNKTLKAKRALQKRIENDFAKYASDHALVAAGTVRVRPSLHVVRMQPSNAHSSDHVSPASTICLSMRHQHQGIVSPFCAAHGRSLQSHTLPNWRASVCCSGQSNHKYFRCKRQRRGRANTPVAAHGQA
jgi:hypothetical protein